MINQLILDYFLASVSPPRYIEVNSYMVTEFLDSAVLEPASGTVPQV